ncbi:MULTISPECIES: nitrite reductase small subunit NirD [Pandoraea]|uniref:nitrite reductase small subunit NirD n=1 Tax=Pandoraea TaxID=93217 RepID=UPI001F5D4C50|nr:MULTISPECIES: nitrite reductase small subunit NirD [Pandoraea]MCI3205211.1 nitrite reductase (NAD(P)H) small subunit [Pandoraea sp. LA3]MDN4583239.1 nitrite reductase (NAD(P)H) small subunit [Pandoraea capi]
MTEQSRPIWLHVCDVNAIPRLGTRVLTHPSGDIALFRTESDNVFALRDKCPHKGGALSQGIVHGEKVTCPLHAWNIDLNTGEACAPDVGCAQRFPVRIDAGEVYLAFDETVQADVSDVNNVTHTVAA